jgi:hypothetical protein
MLHQANPHGRSDEPRRRSITTWIRGQVLNQLDGLGVAGDVMYGQVHFAVMAVTSSPSHVTSAHSGIMCARTMYL